MWKCLAVVLTLWLATTGSNAASILPEAAAAPSEDGQWVMPPKNYANTRVGAPAVEVSAHDWQHSGC
jgi:hypothetical protein